MAESQNPTFALCIGNSRCVDLTLFKVYKVIPDAAASRTGLLRVVDDSGEDYLYPTKNFFAIELPSRIRRALLKKTA